MDLPLLAVTSLGLAAAVTDVRSRIIPNWVSVSLTVFGLGWHAWREGLPGLAAAALGCAAGFGIFLVFYLLGAMGGGDIKLMAACGAVLAVPALFEAAAWAAILGAILALLARSLALLRKTKAATIPYAPAIVTGAWLTLWIRGG